MKKLLTAISAVALLFGCVDSNKNGEVAKNSDWYSSNLKGMVQTMETADYTPDSTGKINAMDSCCVDVEQFDDKGYTTTNTKKDSKGTITEEMTLTRYDQGQAKDMKTMKDGKMASGFQIQINEDGKYSGAQELDSAGNVAFFYTELTEDENGAVTSGKRHKADSTFYGIFYNDYKNGVQVSNRYTDSTGKEVWNATNELNEKGDMEKRTEKSTDKDSTTTTVKTYTYDSYDETGNWTQRTTYDDKGKATKVTKRSFTYFKKD